MRTFCDIVGCGRRSLYSILKLRVEYAPKPTTSTITSTTKNANKVSWPSATKIMTEFERYILQFGMQVSSSIFHSIQYTKKFLVPYTQGCAQCCQCQGPKHWQKSCASIQNDRRFDTSNTRWCVQLVLVIFIFFCLEYRNNNQRILRQSLSMVTEVKGLQPDGISQTEVVCSLSACRANIAALKESLRNARADIYWRKRDLMALYEECLEMRHEVGIYSQMCVT